MSALKFYPPSFAVKERINKPGTFLKRLGFYLLSTKRNRIIDQRIEKVSTSLPVKAWSEMTAEEQVTYTYHRAAMLRAVYRMELLKN